MTHYDEFDDPRNQQTEELKGHVKTRLSSQMRLIGQFVALVLGITVILGGAVWGLNSFVLNQFEPQNTPVVPAEEDTAFKTAPEGEEASPDSGELVPGSDSAIFESFKSDAEKTAEAPPENILDDTSTAETETKTEGATATETPTETAEATTESAKTENLLETAEAPVTPTTDITDITEDKTEEEKSTADTEKSPEKPAEDPSVATETKTPETKTEETTLMVEEAPAMEETSKTVAE